jgi:hypothetical protein
MIVHYANIAYESQLVVSGFIVGILMEWSRSHNEVNDLSYIQFLSCPNL